MKESTNKWQCGVLTLAIMLGAGCALGGVDITNANLTVVAYGEPWSAVSGAATRWT